MKTRISISAVLLVLALCACTKPTCKGKLGCSEGLLPTMQAQATDRAAGLSPTFTPEPTWDKQLPTPFKHGPGLSPFKPEVGPESLSPNEHSITPHWWWRTWEVYNG